MALGFVASGVGSLISLRQSSFVGCRQAAPGKVAHPRARGRGRAELPIRALVFTSKDLDETVSNVLVSGKDQRGHLSTVVRIFEERGFQIAKASLRVANGSVNDSFTIAKDAKALSPDELTELRTVIEKIDSSHEPDTPNQTVRAVPEVTNVEGVLRDYSMGSYAMVDNQKASNYTSVMINGPTSLGVFPLMLDTIASYGCNIIFGVLSTFDGDYSRRHDILHIIGADGKQMDEPSRSSLEKKLTAIAQGEM